MSGSGVQVGYMNAQHQRVVARARTRGNPAIRFVVWCSLCGHYYVADDSEIVRRRCPNHDHAFVAAPSRNVGPADALSEVCRETRIDAK